MNAIIYKSVGGFYTVKTDDEQEIMCKPRGLFRKTKEKLLVGDRVSMGMEAGTWFIDKLFERKNQFVRPPVSNVDQILIVASTTQPVPSLLVLDKLSVVAINQGVKPVLVITKTDEETADFLKKAYEKSGIKLLEVDALLSGNGVMELKEMLCGKLNILCGNSGVGKSTLLNALLPAAKRETGEISKKLGRGRHTTREVEIFEVGDGLIADTPGFASYDLQRISPILASDLQFCFPEIEPRIANCKYTGCAHVSEAGCAVRKAVENGEIAKGRYESYVTLYKQAKEGEKY